MKTLIPLLPTTISEEGGISLIGAGNGKHYHNRVIKHNLLDQPIANKKATDIHIFLLDEFNCFHLAQR